MKAKAKAKDIDLKYRYCRTCEKNTPQEKIASRIDKPSPRWFCHECFMNPDEEAMKQCTMKQ